MPMNNSYLNAVADAGKALITHIGLVNSGGTELSGGSPAYARQAVTWGAAANGDVKISGDEVFNIPPGSNVSGWRAYSAATGGTDYGGGALTSTDFTQQGEYTLQAASTGINHDAS